MLTYIEGKETPIELILMSLQPYVGTTQYENAIAKYPEYFVDELERQRQYDAIPKAVHDAYFKESNDMRNRLFDQTECKGLFYYMDHPEEYREYQERYFAQAPERRRRGQEIWDKYYGPYGLKKLN